MLRTSGDGAVREDRSLEQTLGKGTLAGPSRWSSPASADTTARCCGGADPVG